VAPRISADDGRSGLALFEVREAHAREEIRIGIDFQVDSPSFIAFAERLKDRALSDGEGKSVEVASVADRDLDHTFYCDDPCGKTFELDCCDHAAVKGRPHGQAWNQPRSLLATPNGMG
jgi:hypothetical protein